MNVLNIGIIGVGGVGGYFGGKLAKYFEGNKEYRVYFLARGAHLKQIKAKGLTLIAEKNEPVCCRPFLATDTVSDFPILDVCILCVKAYDLKNVLEQLKDKITPQTEILPLLNGVDIPQRIHQVIPGAKVYPACVYVGTHIKAPGVVEQNGGGARILTGPEKADESKQPKFLSLFDRAGIQYEWTKNNYVEIWQKYMFIAAYGIVTAYYDKTIGQINEDEVLCAKINEITKLIDAVAEKEGVALPEDCRQKTLQKAAAFPYDTKTSFQRDFEQQGRKNEKEIFVDSLIALAQKHGIDDSCITNIVTGK